MITQINTRSLKFYKEDIQGIISPVNQEGRDNKIKGQFKKKYRTTNQRSQLGEIKSRDEDQANIQDHPTRK